MPDGRVFISYRRDDTKHPAGRLADRLVARLGPDRVFMDVDSVEPGADFAETIERAVAQCDVLLALIGSRWTEVTDQQGRRRLDDPDDYVVLEIGTALARGIPVVPVLVDRTPMPRHEKLPSALAPLTRRHAVRLEHESFGADATQLLNLVEARLRQAATDPPAPAGGRPPAEEEISQRAVHQVVDEAEPLAAAGNLTPRQASIARGVRSVYEDLRHTLGPAGATVPVRDERGRWIQAADSYTYALNHRPEDPRDELGAQYMTEMVRAVHDGVGDGGAVAAVLTHALVQGAAGELREGAHPVALTRSLRSGLEAALAAVTAPAQDVCTEKELAAYAAGVAEDTVAGNLVAHAFDKVGRSGVVLVETGPVRGVELRLGKGLRLPAGYLSPHFVTDAERGEAVLENPYVLVANVTISAVDDLLPVLDKVLQSGRPLLVVARDVKGEALSTLVGNTVQGTFRSVAVALRGSGIRQTLADVATVTGAHRVSPEYGEALRDVTLDMLGRARRVVVTEDSMTIVDGEADGEGLAGRINQLRAEVKISDSDFDREKLHERMTQLAGGVATITLSQVDEADDRVRVDRYRRTVRAAYATLAAGLLPGGCTALARAAEAVRPLTRPAGTAGGARLLAGALDAPYRQILANAGVDVPAGEIVEVDASTGQRTGLLAAQAYDSAAVLRATLEAAVATTERFLRTA